MVKKVNRFTWFVVTMSVLLTLACESATGVGEETSTRRVRHARSNNRGSRSSSEESPTLEMEFLKNQNLVEDPQWNCGIPKPELVYLNDSVLDIPPTSRLLGNAAILHRCSQRTGCCTHPRICQPYETTTVNITFKSIHMNTNETTYHQVQFSNHTRCTCR